MKGLILAFTLLFNQPGPPPNSELECLARAVYHEARGEDLRGQSAVAHVVLNRVRDGLHPKTICAVVFQPHQFTNIRQTRINKSSPAWQVAVKTSVLAYTGISTDPTKGARWFFAHGKVPTPKWAHKQISQIGNHSFVGEL